MFVYVCARVYVYVHIYVTIKSTYIHLRDGGHKRDYEEWIWEEMTGEKAMGEVI